MPTESQARQATKQRAIRPRRVLALVLLVIGVIAGALIYRHYTNPERIRAIAEAYLQRYTHGLVTVGSASFSWFGGVRLFDVTVEEVARAAARDGPRQVTTDPTSPVFSCREVRVTHDLASALIGDLKIQSIVALEPTCSILRDLADGRTNLTGLLRSPVGMGRPDPTELPTIELSNSRVRAMSREGDDTRVVEDLRLTVRARPSQRDPQVYDVVWQEGDGRVATGHSQVDLQTGRVRNVRGGLPWMSIEAVMLALNARYDGAGAWCDLLGLEGTVRAVEYNLSRDAGAEEPRSATIELSDASISIPISEQEQSLPPDDRYLRFEQVNGHAQLTAEEITAEFSGLFHGSECKVSATIRGGVKKLITLDDVDFDARLTLERLALPRPDSDSTPAEVRFINHWPQLVHFYRDYNPHGVIDLNIEATRRAGRAEPIVVRRARLTARGGDASCRYFPYRVQNLVGTIEYSPDGVFIRDLRGQRGGGAVTVNGRLAQPTRWATKELAITGTGIPIDDELCRALPARYRKIREQFAPKGTLDVELALTQPAGDDGQAARWESQASIALRGVSANYIGFPYPVDQLTGTLIVDKDSLQVVDVAGRSGEARISVGGTVTFDQGEISNLDLAVRGEDVAFNDPFLTALPAETRGHVNVFHPSGRFDIQTSLTLEPETKKVVHTSLVTLNDVSVQYEKVPVDVTDVLGQLHITPDELVVDGLTGLYRGAIVSAEGIFKRTGAEPAAQLTIRSRGLRIDETLIAALPSKLRSAMEDWQIDGPIAMETTFSTNPADETGTFVIRTLVRLSGAAVHHPFFPIPFHDVQGEVTIDDGGVRATDIAAHYGAASVHADFEVRLGDSSEEGTITLSATGVTLDDSVRGLLPERLFTGSDRLSPAGSIDLHLDRLRWERSGAEARREWLISGYVELNDVALRGVANLERMSGTLTGSGSIVDRLGGTSLSGDLTLSAMTLMGRRLTHTESAWSYARVANGEGRLAFDSIQGRVYDGSLTGRVEAMFDADKSGYNLSTTVRGMQIEPFLNAARAASSAGSEPVEVRGLADGHLYLSGVVGDPSSRRGGGRFEILDGHIYRLPIILAILNVLNLSIPDQDAFDDARADFYIVGNRMQVKDIVLRGGVLALVGSGTMSLPDLGVDLDLVNVSPHRWARVPVLTNLVEAASHELVELHVTGPLSQPTVRVRPFRGIREEFNRLFKKRKPKKIQPAAP
ncbi:MAG: AsmA-like C-terminal region-containing protein [Phycisphaerae bacterium]